MTEDLGVIGTGELGEVAGVPTCRASLDESPIGATDLQIIDVPAHEWAANVESAMEQIRPQADAANRRKVDEGLAQLSDGEVDGKQACEIFSLMVEIQGFPPGSGEVANLYPNKQDPVAANAQSCVDGRFVSVQVEGDDLTPGSAIGDKLLAAVDVVLGQRGA